MRIVLRALLLLAATAAAATAGPPPAHAIVNGTPVSATDLAGRYRGIVGLTQRGSAVFCGGVLVGPGTVATAAHCVVDRAGAAKTATDLGVLAGRLHQRTGGEDLPVASFTVHPAFDPVGLRNDVAVLHLARAAQAPAARLVGAGESALWGAGAGRAVDANGPWVAGWGDTSRRQGRYADVLVEAAMPIRSDQACAGPAPGLNTGWHGASMLCAGETGPAAATTCAGDSGGPLVAADGAGGFRVVGLVSYDVACSNETFQAFTRIDAVRGWIEGNVRQAPAAPGPGGGGEGAAKAPARPLALRAGRRTRTSVTLRWRAGTNGNVATSSYEIVRLGGGGVVPVSRTRRTSATIGRLKPGRRYRFAVRARDRIGRASALSPAVTVATRR